jgi:hypothetical protein
VIWCSACGVLVDSLRVLLLFFSSWLALIFGLCSCVYSRSCGDGTGINASVVALEREFASCEVLDANAMRTQMSSRVLSLIQSYCTLIAYSYWYVNTHDGGTHLTR